MRFGRVIVTAAWLIVGTASVAPAVAAAAEEPVPQPGSVPFTFVDIAGAPSHGPATAPVVIVEFSDFQCPFSAQNARTMRRLLELYPTQVRWVSKQFPLKFHRQAPLAHEAALAAGEQGKFFEMYQLIHSHQDRLARGDLDGYARELGLDMTRFAATLDERRLRPLVVNDILEARRVGVFATPTLFVNGKRMIGAKVLPELRAAIEYEIRTAADGSTAPADSVSDRTK